MRWTVRPATENDWDVVWTLWSIAFGSGDPVEPADRRLLPGQRTFVAEGPTGVVGAYSVYPLSLARGRGSLPAGGISSVAVAPEERHRGVGRALMDSSLATLRETGATLAALYAFRESYYRRFGYEVAGRRWSISCPHHRFPRLPVELPVRRISPDEVEALAPCYDAMATWVAGLNRRTSAHWRHRLGKKPPHVYTVGDPVEAYAWVTWGGPMWEPLKVGEMAWASRSGYLSLLGLLAGLIVNRSALQWSEPSLSPFLCEFYDQGVEATLSRAWMVRVLDVPRALACLCPEDEGEFRLEVRDEQLPDNRGPWWVRYRSGQVEVDRASDADLRLDVRFFSAALLGEPSLADLARAGVVEVVSSDALRSALRLLPPMPVCCMDFF